MRSFLFGLSALLVAAAMTACGDDSGGGDEEVATGGGAGVSGVGGGGTGGAKPGTGGSPATGGSPGTGGGTGATWIADKRPDVPAGAKCADVSIVRAKPEADILLVSTWQEAIYSSTDGAQTFTKLGDAKHGPVAMVIDPVTPTTFWQSGMYGGPGIVRTTDNGATWATLGTISHLDGMSVDLSDPNRMTLMAGGHEQKQSLQRSTDGGQTWTNIGTNLGASLSSCTYPLIIDAATYLVGCSGNGWIDGDLGVYRSADSGATWTRASSASATDQGPAPEPLWASDGTIYWTIVYNRGMLISTDKGVTWTKRFNWNDIYPGTPTELPDGRIAVAGPKGKQIQITSDKGKTWKAIGPALPYDPSGITYSSFRKAFFIWHGECNNPTSKDAIMHFPFE